MYWEERMMVSDSNIEVQRGGDSIQEGWATTAIVMVGVGVGVGCCSCDFNANDQYDDGTQTKKGGWPDVMNSVRWPERPPFPSVGANIYIARLDCARIIFRNFGQQEISVGTKILFHLDTH